MLARRHLHALSSTGHAPARRPAPPRFLVTGINDTPHGVLVGVQRLERGSRRALTDDTRVLHLDQVAIQMTRCGEFYVKEPRVAATQAVWHRLEIHRDGAGSWMVRAIDLPGAHAAVEALPSIPDLGVVTAAFARDAAERALPADLEDPVV